MKQDPCNGSWKEVDDDVAREKASQCLRDIVASRAKVCSSVFSSEDVDVQKTSNRVAKRSSAPEMMSIALHTSESFSKRLKNSTSQEYGANATFPVMSMNDDDMPSVKQDRKSSMVSSYSVPRNLRKVGSSRNNDVLNQSMATSKTGINPLLNYTRNHDKRTTSTMFLNRRSLYEHPATRTNFLSNNTNREELELLDMELNDIASSDDGLGTSNSTAHCSSLSQFLLLQDRMN